MARTSAAARWQRVQALPDPNQHPNPAPHPQHRPAIPLPGDCPIYDQLTQEWLGTGRTLPGVPDLEWTRLTQFPLPQRSAADLLTGPAPPSRGWLHS
ncbi:hypothetical protein [Streptomyces sp. NPDC020965]|uniref:hypothetical protein n=1 Tax=Streptomyces sp. NPDC020965 TaxID=3365105 RepID=UPI0037B2D542